MAELLLEIGTEEVPAGFLKKEINTLQTSFIAAMRNEGLDFETATVMATPRRLALMAHGLKNIQNTKEEIITGPAVKAAYNANNEPTQALLGFCRANDINPENTFIRTTPKGEYIAVKKTIGGKTAAEVLQQIIPSLINSLPFPKSMRWGDYDLNYARPLRWLVCMLDDQVVPVSVGPVVAGNVTFGHRIHGPGPFAIAHAQNYPEIIKEQCAVIIDPQERVNIIKDAGEQLAKAKNGHVIWKDDLLEEVSGLVEHPVPVLGNFDSAYLDIPEEVLLTSMQSHQKSFGVRGQDGKLLPYFLTTLNIAPQNLELVKKGWERVLRARLEDARFFWQEDLKIPLATRQKKLENVIFIGPLGSMAEKSRRLASLCAWLAEKTGLANPKLAARAGELAKNDLVSGMVGEFDTLQGIMGGIYAERAGENKEVAKAISEQYLPLGPDSPLPATPMGSILAIANKTDTLTGCFALGMIPTGTADPNGLRRGALGILRIFLKLNIELNLDDLFLESLELYGEKPWKFEAKETLQKLQEFMLGRLRGIFLAEGFSTHLIDAVLNSNFTCPSDAQRKLEALKKFESSPEYISAIQVLKRLENILKKQSIDAAEWDDSLLAEEAEQNLANELKNILPVLDNDLEKADYSAALQKLTELRGPVDNFFEKIMVMTEDQKLRANRVALLNAIYKRYKKIAKFSMLQI